MILFFLNYAFIFLTEVISNSMSVLGNKALMSSSKSYGYEITLYMLKNLLNKTKKDWNFKGLHTVSMHYSIVYIETILYSVPTQICCTFLCNMYSTLFTAFSLHILFPLCHRHPTFHLSILKIFFFLS